MKVNEDRAVRAYFAADAVRKRIQRQGGRVSLEEMGHMVGRAYGVLSRFRSIRRIQVNRDIVERSDLGGEGGEGLMANNARISDEQRHYESTHMGASVPPEEVETIVNGHVFEVTKTTAPGFHTGRTRYKVHCTTCGMLVHEATTGPAQQIEYHLREIGHYAEGE